MVLDKALDELVIKAFIVGVQVGAACISQVAEGKVGGGQYCAREVPVLEDSCTHSSNGLLALADAVILCKQ